jgi:putative Mn2+ efflux pump MntP
VWGKVVLYLKPMAKHFLKTLVVFIGMIILGLIGVFLVSYFDKGGESVNTPNSKVQVAK